ncbi:hypothetical protein MJO29_016907 [Puccinia striiformis f. sp. tritici]|nr:hypothetical protein MJO29_016907 [Puccinia striiformis f. sp. tritici]
MLMGIKQSKSAFPRQPTDKELSKMPDLGSGSPVFPVTADYLIPASTRQLGAPQNEWVMVSRNIACDEFGSMDSHLWDLVSRLTT